MTAFGTQVVSKTALFRLRGEGFALPVLGIDHIIEAPRLFPLPRLDELFLGVFVLDKEVVPLLNLHTYLDLETHESSKGDSFAVLFLTDFGKIALPADEVLGIVENTQGSLEKEVGGAGMNTDRFFLYDDVRYPLFSDRNLMAILTG